MAESKSDGFALNVQGCSEKRPELASLFINSLVGISEYVRSVIEPEGFHGFRAY